MKRFGVHSLLFKVPAGICSMYLPMALCAVRHIEGGAGGGGEPWYGTEIADEGLKETLGSFESRDAAFAALHENRLASSKSLTERIVAEDPELTEHAGLFDRFKSPAALAKSYAELNKKFSEGGGLKPPGESATEEEKAEFSRQLAKLAGCPETPEGYSYKPTQEAIDAGLDMEHLKGRMKELHEAGFSDAQVTKAMQLFEEESALSMDRLQAMLDEQYKEARDWGVKRWGSDADANFRLAGRAMEKFGLKESLYNSGLLNDYRVIDVFHQLAEAIGEGSLPAAGGGAGSAQERLSALMADPAYANPRLRVGDKANIMQDILELRKQIPGGGK